MDSVTNHYRIFARGRGGAGYKVIGTYTDLYTSLQRQLGKQDFYSNSSLDKGVCGCMCRGKKVAKFLRITLTYMYTATMEAYTEFCIQRKRTLARNTIHKDVCARTCGGKNEAKFYVSHVHMHVHVYC